MVGVRIVPFLIYTPCHDHGHYHALTMVIDHRFLWFFFGLITL
jgi:hypothetical protein